jgi:hypothetical protein
MHLTPRESQMLSFVALHIDDVGYSPASGPDRVHASNFARGPTSSAS